MNKPFKEMKEGPLKRTVEYHMRDLANGIEGKLSNFIWNRRQVAQAVQEAMAERGLYPRLPETTGGVPERPVPGIRYLAEDYHGTSAIPMASVPPVEEQPYRSVKFHDAWSYAIKAGTPLRPPLEYGPQKYAALDERRGVFLGGSQLDCGGGCPMGVKTVGTIDDLPDEEAKELARWMIGRMGREEDHA